MRNKDIKEFSVVVPVYNSAESLHELYKRLKSVFMNMGKSFEIIFVNDCSKDESIRVLKEIREQNENVTIIDLCRKFGLSLLRVVITRMVKTN